MHDDYLEHAGVGGHVQGGDHGVREHDNHLDLQDRGGTAYVLASSPLDGDGHVDGLLVLHRQRLERGVQGVHAAELRIRREHAFLSEIEGFLELLVDLAERGVVVQRHRLKLVPAHVHELEPQLKLLSVLQKVHCNRI